MYLNSAYLYEYTNDCIRMCSSFRPSSEELCGHAELFKMFNETTVDSKYSATPCTITYLNKKNEKETFYPFFGYAKEGQLMVQYEFIRTVLLILTIAYSHD